MGTHPRPRWHQLVTGARERIAGLFAARGARAWVLRGGIALGVFVVAAVAGFGVLYATVSLPPEPEQAQTSVVLDRHGEVVAELHAEEHRYVVALDEVSRIMQQAVVATEDRNFYRHTGLDPIGITRAAYRNLRGDRQGGSTLTQQLVKNQYLSPDRSLVRKVREAVLAIKVEQRHSKEGILERYLNTVYFGRGAYGVESAAQAYFGVPAAELDLAQSALLAGLIRAPESADPDRDPDAARTRRAIALRSLVETGVVDEDEAAAAGRQPLGTLPRNADSSIEAAGGAAYFVDQVRAWAVRTYGERTAFGGGLRIHTTLDLRLQAMAEQAVASVLDQPDDPEAALVMLDPDGGIVAMVGGRDFRESKVNLALGPEAGGSGRQAGSTFKPIVLAAAVEAGIPVRTTYPAPARIRIDTAGGPWEVANFGNTDYGSLDLVEGTVHSSNTVYAQLMDEVGPEAVVRTASRLGISSELQPLPSLALGAQEVSPLEMARAFSTFANRGTRTTPHYVTRVVDHRGTTIHTTEVERADVMPTQHADLVNWVLRQAVERGTGRAAAIGRPVAGKTGTTQDFGDAWFVGYTPGYTTAVWMGYPEGQARSMTDVRGRRVTGGSFPATIWQRFMVEAMAGVETGDFEQPPAELLEVPPHQREPDPEDETEGEDTTTTTEPEDTTTTTEPADTTTTTASTTTTTAPPTTTTTRPEDTTTTTQPANGSGRGSGSSDGGADGASTGGDTTTTTTTVPDGS